MTSSSHVCIVIQDLEHKRLLKNVCYFFRKTKFSFPYSVESFNEISELHNIVTKPDALYIIFKELNSHHASEFNAFLTGRTEKIQIIFYSDKVLSFGLDAFRQGAANILLKPIRYSRFLQALQRALKTTDPSLRAEQDEKTVKIRKNYPDFLIVRDGDHKKRKLDVSQILYFKSTGNQTEVHSTLGLFQMCQPLCKIEESLDSDFFFRISRKHVVNFDYFKEFKKDEKGEILITLDNQEELPISVAAYRKLAINIREKLICLSMESLI